MPLKRMLDQSRNFDPRAVAILLEAFNDVVAELGLRAAEERDQAAKIIIRLAVGQRDLDATQLRDSTVALMRNERM